MCCISLACHIHRDASRVFDQCTDKLYRGACSRNTVQFVKNDPNLTCVQCSIRLIEQTAPVTSDLLYKSEGRLLVAARDQNEFENIWADDNPTEKSSITQLQPLLSAFPYSRPVSTIVDCYSPGYLQPSEYDSAELSYEEGLWLIDDMYVAQDLDPAAVSCMGSYHEGVHFAWVETQCELEQAHEMTKQMTEFIRNSGVDEEDMTIISDGCSNLPYEHCFASARSNTSCEQFFEAQMTDTRGPIWQPQRELENFEYVRGENGPAVPVELPGIYGTDAVLCRRRVLTGNSRQEQYYRGDQNATGRGW